MFIAGVIVKIITVDLHLPAGKCGEVGVACLCHYLHSIVTESQVGSFPVIQEPSRTKNNFLSSCPDRKILIAWGKWRKI